MVGRTAFKQRLVIFGTLFRSIIMIRNLSYTIIQKMEDITDTILLYFRQVSVVRGLQFLAFTFVCIRR